MFIVLLSFTGSLATKCMSLNNKQCKTRLALIDLNPVELNYYLFMIALDKFNGSSNTPIEIFCRICVSNKTEDVNWIVFNSITRKNESKTLTKHISCKCKWKVDGNKCNYRNDNYYDKNCSSKSISKNFNKDRVICKMRDFYTLLAFLFITTTSLIAVSIYCCIKYWAKQKHLLQYHDANI